MEGFRCLAANYGNLDGLLFALVKVKRRLTMKRQWIAIWSLSLLATPGWASNALRGKSFSAEQMIRPTRQELKVTHKRVSHERPLLTHQDVAEIVDVNAIPQPQFVDTERGQAVMPTGANVVQTEDQMMGRILQNTANKLMKTEIVTNSFLMKTAKQVENSTKVDVAIKQENSMPQQKDIEHKFNLDVQPLQGMAKITYRGLIDSRIEYQASNSTFQLSLEEQISGNSRIALSHVNDPRESRQFLQYQVSW
jgi:hypothetical protein